MWAVKGEREGERVCVGERVGYRIGAREMRERGRVSELLTGGIYTERGKEGLCVGERVRVRSIKRVEWRRRESGERENNRRGI